MTSFRFLLTADDREFSDRQLDWDPKSGRWLLSRREYGSVTWDLDLVPSSDDISELANFFRLDESLAVDVVVCTAPDGLAALHLAGNANPTIQVEVCPACGRHWNVIRLVNGEWLRYGMTCDLGLNWGVPVVSS